MAKIIFGPIVAEARGRQGNLVFSRNQYGAYTSPYTAPDETTSPAREVVWTRMLDASTAWEDDLDDEQRRAWGSFAKLLHYRDVFNHRKNHSGRQPFISNYFYLDALNLPINLDPPASTRRFNLLTASLQVNSDDLQILLTTTWDPTQDQPPVIVYATPGLSSTRISPGHRFKQIAALQDDVVYPYNLWADYVAVHPAPTSCQRVFVRARPIHPTTGLSGVPLVCSGADAALGDAMLHATVSLTNDQIKALPSTPITIVAGVTAKIIVLHTLLLHLKNAAAAYTNLATDPSDAIYAYMSEPYSNRKKVSGWLDNPADSSCSLTPPSIPTAIDDYELTNYHTDDITIAAPLQLAAVNSLGNFTGGNAANSLICHIYYSLLPA